MTPEAVALELLKIIAAVEKKSLMSAGAGLLAGEGFTTADRGWILQTYAECLSVVKGATLSRLAGPDRRS